MTFTIPHTFTVCYVCHRPLLNTDPFDLVWVNGGMRNQCGFGWIGGCKA